MMQDKAQAERTGPLVSVVLVAAGTAQQRAETRESIESQPPGVVELVESSEVDVSQGTLNLSTCKGSYVLFLEPGDRLMPEFGDEVNRVLTEKTDVLFLSCFLNRVGSRVRPALKYATWERKLSLATMLSSMHLTICCKLIRRELLSVQETHEEILLRVHAGGGISRAYESPLVWRWQDDAAGDGVESVSIEDKVHTYRSDVACMRTIADRLPLISPNINKAEMGKVLLRRIFDEGHALVPLLPPLKAVRFLLYVWRQGFAFLPLCGCSRVLKGWGGSLFRNLREARAGKRQCDELENRVAALRRKPLIRVLFLVVNPAIWKNDSLMRALLAHPRFEAEALVVPQRPLLSVEKTRNQMEEMRRFMEERGYPVFELCSGCGERGGPPQRIPEGYDILFYPQPYEGLVPSCFDFPKHRDRLWICTTYGLHTTILPRLYRTPFRDLAWMDCFENEHTAAVGRRIKRVRDNVVVTGLPFSDRFFFPPKTYSSPWNVQTSAVKRIIWAPHWSIGDKTQLTLSCFLRMAEEMLSLARETVGRVQWALKPHPWLYQKLCQHPEWGQERTDAYYAFWEKGVNTQLETGDYVALFTHSDAMVHDCSSFCCEYHHTAKPVLFLSRDMKGWLSDSNSMAKSAMEAHYVGHGVEDVRHFVYDTVLGEKDPLRSKREAFRDEYLRPPHGRSAAENIINYILTGEVNPQQEAL